MPDPSLQARKGLLASLSALAATLLAMAHTRLDLLSLDLEEERAHLFSLLQLTLIALFCLGVGVLLATIFLVAAFWDSHRLLVLGTLAILFLLVSAATWAYALRKAERKPRLFASSLAELSRDQQQLSSRS